MFDHIPDLVQSYIDYCLASEFSIASELIRVVTETDRDECVTLERSHLLTLSKVTIKIERFEDYSPEAFELCHYFANLYGHKGPVTAHVFNSVRHAYTFSEHTDPDDVVIYGVRGTKTMVVDGVPVTIGPGQHIFIKANTPHMATNEHDSTMVSIGLEKWLKDKL